MMMIPTRRDKRGAFAHPLRQFEPKYIAIKAQCAIQIRHLQMNVTNSDAGIDWSWFHGAGSDARLLLKVSLPDILEVSNKSLVAQASLPVNICWVSPSGTTS